MIIDASAIVAIALDQTHAAWALEQMTRVESQKKLQMSFINIAEAGMALNRVNTQAGGQLMALLEQAGIEALSPDADIVRLAIAARDRFPLNFGDCFAYAHAAWSDEALLTLDSDFLKTDLRLVLHPDRH